MKGIVRAVTGVVFGIALASPRCYSFGVREHIFEVVRVAPIGDLNGEDSGDALEIAGSAKKEPLRSASW
jgi:hypothetical protein